MSRSHNSYEYWPYGIRGAGDDPVAYRQLFQTYGFEAFELVDDGTLAMADWARMDRDFGPEILCLIALTPISYLRNLVFDRVEHPR